MKVDQLKNIIKEAVREAVREEIKEILNEAVLNSSTPNIKPDTKSVTKPAVKKHVKSGDPILEMLNMTQQSMTREDFKNVTGGNIQPGMESINFNTNSIPISAPAGPQPGLDISQLGFVKNAAAVYNKSVEKDRFKVGM